MGDARVSTKHQDRALQLDALKAAGCSIILEEKITGTKCDGREQLELALKLLHVTRRRRKLDGAGAGGGITHTSYKRA